MTTNELKALAHWQRAEMLYFRGQGGDIMQAADCLERCAYYIMMMGEAIDYHGRWQEYADSDFVVEYASTEIQPEKLHRDLTILRSWFGWDASCFINNGSDF
jgi:hypothetical protein